MSLAFTSPPYINWETENVVVHQVYCMKCNVDIGSMTLKDVFRALQWRGQILCPSCRQRTCDYCAFTGEEELASFPHPLLQKLTVRRCYWCTEEVRQEPERWFQSLTHEDDRPPCLSSSPYLNRTAGNNGY